MLISRHVSSWMDGFDDFGTLEPRSSRVPSRIIVSALYLNWAVVILLHSYQMVEICSPLRLLLIVWTIICRSRSFTMIDPMITVAPPLELQLSSLTGKISDVSQV
jgi:hypothetical protein